jgi:hypothetical protein
LGKTEQDFLALPASVDKGLHTRLHTGIDNLRKRALQMCIQPTPGSTTTTGTQTAETNTTSTETQTTEATPPPTSTQTTPVEPPSSEGESEEEGGGTAAPKEGESGEDNPNVGGASPEGGQ